MKVKLIAHTPDPDRVVASAAKLCYSSVGVEDMNLTNESVEKFLNVLMKLGHESPIEHVTFTFAVEGVSRVLTHQLVRHRIASYSLQSQRYVRLNSFEYIIPPEIAKIPEAKEAFINKMHYDQLTYDYLVEQLMNNGRNEKEAIEDARYIFPNACETKIVFTMNARTLYNFFKHRCCNRAQWEIRQLADEILREVQRVSPLVFKYAGAACTKGKCPEGAMTCGNPKQSK